MVDEDKNELTSQPSANIIDMIQEMPRAQWANDLNLLSECVYRM